MCEVLKFDNKIFKNIEYVIFDLGGVLVQIDFLKPLILFKEYGIENIQFIYNQDQQSELFTLFEKGLITEENFLNELWNNLSMPPIDYEKLKEIWNSIIIDIPSEVLSCLEILKNRYRLFVLSNTNVIHIQYLYSLLKEKKGIDNFEKYFQKVYYSFQIGCKKPEDKIFKHVIEDAKLDPVKTLFIDDTPTNIEKGKEFGFQVFLMPKGKLLSDTIR